MDFKDSGDMGFADPRLQDGGPSGTASRRPNVEARSLMEWVRVLRDGWPAVIVMVVLGLAGGAAATKLQPTEYSTTATLVTGSVTGFLDPEFAGGLQPVASTVTRLAGSAAVIQGASTGYLGAAKDATTLSRRQKEATIDWLSAHLDARQVADAGIVQLTGKAGTQADARDLTRAASRALEQALAPAGTTVPTRSAGPGGTTQATGRGPKFGILLRDFKTLDDGQVSPTPSRNLLLGGNVGLVLGIVAGLALGASRRRVRRPDEMVAELGIPVLGSVGRSGGARIDPGLSAARARLQRLRNPDQGTVFLLTGTASPERTAELGEDLARAFSASSRTVLVDADLAEQSASRRLDVDGLPGLGELLNGHGPQQGTMFRPEQVLVTTIDGETQGDVEVLPAGEAPTDAAAALSGGGLVRSLQNLRLQYDFVLVVGPGLDRPAEVIPLVAATDWSVLVTPHGERAKTLEAAHGMADALAGRVAGALIVDRR
ncbi:MAG: tyrosine-protein kinase [Thermoleophilaceae bacterium]|nr:tyrosine-protein kinase [Thermoleophilaceae bacterium]